MDDVVPFPAYATEPELLTGSPRRVRYTPGVRLARRSLPNLLGLIVTLALTAGGYDARGAAALWYAVAFFGLIVGGLVLYAAELHLWERRSLLERGEPVEACVLERFHDGRIVYGYSLPDGRDFESMLHAERPRFDALPVGASFTALYDAREPDRHLPYFLFRECEVDTGRDG